MARILVNCGCEDAPCCGCDDVVLTGVDALEAIREDEDAAIDDEPDQFLTDAEADGDALASAGVGTAEDYGDFGETSEW